MRYFLLKLVFSSTVALGATPLDCQEVLRELGCASSFKLCKLLEDRPSIDSDPLVTQLIETVTRGEKSIFFYEEHEDKFWREGFAYFRRTVKGKLEYSQDKSIVSIDIFNINAQPLFPYMVVKDDRTTLTILYAMQKILDLEGVGEVRLQISKFANLEFKNALIRYGFIEESNKSVSIIFKKES